MLMHFDPLQELGRFLGRVAPVGSSLPFPMDARRRDDELIVELDLPGVDPEAIEVTVQGDQLTVRAHRQRHVPEGAEMVAAERAHGSFTRQLMLGEALDSDRLEAHYDKGVLTLHIPVAQNAQPRKIKVGSRRPALAA